MNKFQRMSGATPSRSVWRRRSINHLSPDTLSAPCHPVGDPVSVTLMTTQTTIQGAGAISVESLGRCCEPGNENIVGNFALVCCPGGRLEYSHKNRPPLGKMWRQDFLSFSPSFLHSFVLSFFPSPSLLSYFPTPPFPSQ